MSHREGLTWMERLHRLFVFLSTAGMSKVVGPYRARGEQEGKG